MNESNEIERIVAIFTILNDIIFGQKPVPEDHSEVSWLGGTERVEIEPNADLRVVDRAFLHGDVVARADDALGAQGVAAAVHLDLDLRFADGSLVRGVNARRVAHVRAFRPGHYVAYGDWVGKIHDVVEDVVVRFEDGAECVVAGADEETLVPRDRSTLFADEEHCPFFPGAVVHAAANVWRDARWTRGTRSEAPSLDGGGRGEGDDDDEPGATAPTAPAAPARKKKSLSARVSAMRARTKGVVFEVRTAEVTVRWLACARKSETDEYDYSAKGAFPRAPRTPGTQAEGGAPAPPTQMPASALKPLTHFAHTCFQLGDRTVVPETPPPKSHTCTNATRASGDAGEALNLIPSDGYDSDFPDVSNVSNDRYEGGGVDGFGIARAHQAASAGAGVAASVCESVGAALEMNRALARLFKDKRVSENAAIPALRPAATVVGTRTYVDVLWQDGSTTRRIAARDLVPQLHLGEHDFWPGQFVTRRADDRNPPRADGGTAAAGAAGVADIAAALGAGADAAAVPRHGQTGVAPAGAPGGAGDSSSEVATLSPFGVVETVDQLERVATVRWLPPDAAFPDPCANTMRWVAAEERWVDFGSRAAVEREDDRERVSVYEIREDEEYGFRLGDIVVAPSRFDAELARRKEKGEPFACMLAHAEKDLLDLESDEERRTENDGDEEDSDVSSEYEDADDADASASTPVSVAIEAARAARAARVEGTPLHPGEDRTSRSVREKPLVPPDAASLTWVGEVIGASGGFIRVAWGDGSVSNCHPKFAWVVSHDDDDSDSELSSGDEFESGDETDASGWETLGEEHADILLNELAPAFAATRDGPDAETLIPRSDSSPGTSIASPLGVRRGVPEAAPSLAGPPGGFSGSAALDPIARAYVERRREEAEFGWLAEHARRSGASEPSSDASNALNALNASNASNALNASNANASNALNALNASNANASNASGSSPLTPEEASRAAAALAAAFSGLRSAGAPETSTPRLATSEASSPSRETANETSSVENLASSPVEEEEEEEEGEESAKNEEIEFSALHPRTNDDAFPAFASVDIDDEDVDAALADHRFKETPATGPADLPAWSKAVRKEWRTLRTSLPANVWVRVFEQRTDVLRAAMLGPEGTPYHDNVFVFDFSFPPGYPNEPPASSYHSRGERVNPNLYENGKVCLSLLSTWSGKGSEMWDPKRSNMLQVLVSIQGLVLVDDPYYNEAGYEKQSGTAEGKRNGDQYNEQAFLASARSMISTVRDPPRHFEPLIRAHFHARAPKILRVCRAYLDEGCPIGQYDARLVSENVSADAGGSGTTGKADAAAEPPSRSASQSSGSEKKAPSRPPPTEGFKLTLRKLVPKLEAAFKANDELVDASERGERART